jgi:hypothetical protein
MAPKEKNSISKKRIAVNKRAIRRQKIAIHQKIRKTQKTFTRRTRKSAIYIVGREIMRTKAQSLMIAF